MKLKPTLIITSLLSLLILIISFVSYSKEPLYLEASKGETEMERTDNKSLDEKMNEILDTKALKGAVVGVTVKRATDGETIYAHQGDTLLHPASNMKLLTGIAALEILGEDHHFQTEVLTDGNLIGNTLHGNVYLKGKGDPTLLPSDFVQLAQTLKEQGIHKIDGNLVADDSWYDDIRLSQDLNWSDEPFHTGAQVSALTLSPNQDYEAGTVIIEVTSEQTPEGKAQIQVIPETNYVSLINETTIGSSEDITVERIHGTNQIVVKGSLPEDGTTSRFWSSVWEPAGLSLAIFRDALAAQGIELTSDSEDTFRRTPTDAALLTKKESIPLHEILLPFMKLSNNGIAEVLTKEMGKVIHGEGSWDKGLDVITNIVESFGIEPETFLLRDGSGMSHKNLISSNQLTHLLYEVQNKDWFETFYHSLPVAGEDDRLGGGTLRHRLKAEPAKGNVSAKTGLITGVSTLSGYITTTNEEKIIFSILINNHLGTSEASQAIENEIVKTLTEHEF